MNRRQFLTGGAAVAFVGGFSNHSAAGNTVTGSVQSEIVLFKNSQDPLRGTVSMSQWEWPGVALTANTSRFSADYLSGAVLQRASWVVVWNPMYPGEETSEKTGVRLVNFDNGPKNISEISSIRPVSGVLAKSPRVDVRSVTDNFNKMISNGISKQVGNQTIGNGKNGCLIYASWIEFVWRLT